ncbi:MAG: ATP-binding cassette domain-containing protein [Lachnospiraceae bacterium]|nr:ATP-binding cassette domain-containing protein [Lachnospiraceae bacterium]
MITFQDICKSYRVAKRESGLGNAVKSFFKRDYTLIEAIKGISFSIRDGEMVGYIGPNGAGKSTTIKILSGILMPDSGTCIVNGQVPWKDRKEYVRQIGVVFGQRSQLWWDIPVMDSFELLQAIYAIPSATYRSKLDELTELLHLEELLKTPTRQLSLGQRMRCELAASLLHDPKLLFLDEPTIGLDAVSKIAVRDFIKKMNEEHKTTVILTTHDMQDIEAIANRVILIGRGQKLMDGTLDDLRAEAESMETETGAADGGNEETDLDHMIAHLYTKLNIM